MLCKSCRTAMGIGTTFEQKKDGKPSARRSHECIKCHDKVYIKTYILGNNEKRIREK